MFYYLIGLGSNIQPQKHLIQAIKYLGNQVDILGKSQVLINPPCGTSFHYEFHNQLLLIRTELPQDRLKPLLEDIELTLGREAKSPARKLNDRTIDIDIIRQGDSATALFTSPLEESYNRQILAQWTEVQSFSN
jgi:2-amino-4-hydroxy-6-hydroxymethyldihydropteridine diphosphokinase